MSFKVSGSTWVPQSAYEHATSMLATMNTALSPLGITLKASMLNVIWWICLGLGALASVYDQALATAEDSFDVALCSDEQIENLLPVAGVTRIAGSYSTLVVAFTGDATGQTVPAGTHITILNQTYKFVLDSALVVPASGTASGISTCDTLGEIVVLSGQVSGTVETLAHIASVTNTVSAVAGSNQETTPALRKRIINGLTISNNIDGLAVALRNLAGIQYAKTYFNPSTSTALTLPGGISLAARTAYMVVKGTSSKIAETYASICLAPTQGDQTQNWTSEAGQIIPIKYNLAGETPVHVRVFVEQDDPYDAGYLIILRQDIEALASELTIGQSITQQFIASAFENFPYATITGVEVSLDGSSWGRTAVVPANSIATFTDANITSVLE